MIEFLPQRGSAAAIKRQVIVVDRSFAITASDVDYVIIRVQDPIAPESHALSPAGQGHVGWVLA